MKSYIYALRYLLNKNDSITKYMIILHVARAHLMYTVIARVCVFICTTSWHLKQNQFNGVFPKYFH